MAFNFNSVAMFLFVACTISNVGAQVRVFHITKYGATPNSDVTSALVNAWKLACASATPSKIVVPKGKFILGVVKFDGPCKAPIELNVQGILQSPSDLAMFKGADAWLTFGRIDRFTMSGNGVFDGQGQIAWTKNDCHKNFKCVRLPMNLRFNFLTNSTIMGVTTKDSKIFHVNVSGCKNFTFENFKISAPAESPNTDGIHIGRSLGINIIDSIIETGDDCISIGDGSQHVKIERVKCGPGHGISVGSLGKYKNEEPVIGITVKNCTFTNTENGVRIKTWPALEPGIASDMHFENIMMNNVANPVIVDQEYCPWNMCKLTAPSKVRISNVSFKNIKGTTTTREAVKLICSKGFPCKNIVVGNINLKYNGPQPQGPTIAVCKNLKPIILGNLFPAGCTA